VLVDAALGINVRVHCLARDRVVFVEPVTEVQKLAALRTKWAKGILFRELGWLLADGTRLGHDQQVPRGPLRGKNFSGV